jgi:hypothetical protein
VSIAFCCNLGVGFDSNGGSTVSWRRGIRAVLIGAIVFFVALIYVPQCSVRIYAENAIPASLGIAALTTFFAYRA